MEIDVAEGMSRALNIGVIITLRRGLNQHQTLASGGRRTTQKEWRLFNSLSLSLSHNLSITPIQQLSPTPKPLSGCQDTTHKFHHSNIWNKGGWEGCQDRPGVSLWP